MNPVISLATEVTYPNYCNRLKLSALKYYFDSGLSDFGIKYYISTNMPDEFSEYSDNSNVCVYHVDDLRKDCTKSFEHELLPENPIGLYPSRYPWNLRRYIIRQAAISGSNYVIYLDADNIFSTTDGTTLNNILINNYEPNIVSTNQCIFRYENKAPGDVFEHHDKYIDHFKTNYNTEDHDTIDGPVQVFMGDSSDDIIRFMNKWTELTIFGYEKPLGVGYANNKHGNLSFVIPMSNFKLKWKNFPFHPNHIFSDRY
jgi:hypothetical protein